MKITNAKKMFSGLGLTGILLGSICCVLPLLGLTLGSGILSIWLPYLEWFGFVMFAVSLGYAGFYMMKRGKSGKACIANCESKPGYNTVNNRLEDTLSNDGIACNMDVFTETERQNHYTDSKHILMQAEKVEELENGYALRHSYSPENFISIAEWITRENKCCPFMVFNLTLQPLEDDLKIWLKFGGSKQIKTYISMNRKKQGW